MSGKTRGTERRGRRGEAGTLAGRVSPGASYLTVRELLANPRLGLELFAGSGGLERPVRSPRIRRFALGRGGWAAGAGEGLAVLQPAALGAVSRLPRVAQRRLYRELSDGGVAALLLSRTSPVPEALLEAARDRGLPLLLAREALGRSLPRVGFFLKNRLGAEITVHGVLIEVFGLGVLLRGPSGIGKSECALELVTRGHRLIADDMVIAHRAENLSLMGSGSGLARYHMEVRGLGIIDVKELFGVAAVLSSKEIELVVELRSWREGEPYDRLGLDERYHRILDIPLPLLSVPVTPGRNLAVIVEVASRNHLLKRQGYHAPRELNRRILERLQGRAR